MSNNRIEMDMEAIISSEEIKLILDRYRIGKKPLAKLLGWGETTIIRYMEGDVPTNEYSNKLRTILDDPEFYYDMLCRRKDCLTGVAFKKSKHAVMTKIMSSKIYAVAYYMVNKSCAEICPSYIQYLLYYAQAFSLALNDKEIFQEECGINNEHMPYLKIFESMKKCGVRTLDGCEEYLSEEEIELIDTVMEVFLWYGPKALNAMLEAERAIMKISRDRYNNRIIAKDVIKGYFKEMMTQFQITGLKDLGRYPEQKMLELKGIYSA